MSFKRKVFLSVCIAFCISIFYSIVSFADTSKNIREEVLRLHVLANSDSYEDQQLKLKVRDAVLDAGSSLFNGSTDINNVSKRLNEEKGYLISVAQDIIKKQGYNYDVEIVLSEEYFTTKTYQTVTLPAGKYLALKVIIGKGEGQNWWCVMFPPMCITAADETEELSSVLKENEVKLVEKNPVFEPRFKIIELFEKLKNRFSDY